MALEPASLMLPSPILLAVCSVEDETGVGAGVKGDSDEDLRARVHALGGSGVRIGIGLDIADSRHLR